MNFRGRITKFCHSVLTFSVLSTTFVTLLIYAAIWISIIVVYEVLPKAPSHSHQLGLDLSTAFRDLQVVCIMFLTVKILNSYADRWWPTPL